MTRRVRIGMALPALALLGVLFTWALAGLPKFGDYRGPYGDVLNRVAVPERHMSNVATAVVFDYRGFDTMGEEFILLTAVTGVVLLLRTQERDDAGELTDAVRSDGVRVGGTLTVALAILVGLFVVAFGFVTPGGGFQGGVALASAVLLLFLTASWKAWAGVADSRFLDPLEGVGAGGYVVVGLVALANGLPFLTNLLGPGKTGTLVSGGSAPFVNWCAALEVSAALLILFAEFLEEYVVPLARKEPAA